MTDTTTTHPEGRSFERPVLRIGEAEKRNGVTLKQAQQDAEPVVWRILDKDPLGCGDDRWIFYTQDDFKPGVCPTDYFNIEPLYTHPAPKQEPLSDEQIDAITISQWGDMHGFPLAAHRAYARAVEAAHGIKGETK